MNRTLRIKFKAHKDNARSRGIPFELTFEQWMSIWRNSGRLSQRGRGRGEFVMARFGDIGPYAVDNVQIVTTGQNVRETYCPPSRLEDCRIRMLCNSYTLATKE